MVNDGWFVALKLGIEPRLPLNNGLQNRGLGVRAPKLLPFKHKAPRFFFGGFFEFFKLNYAFFRSRAIHAISNG